MLKTLILPVCLFFTAVALEADEYTVAMVPRSTSTEFWKSVHKGALKAVDELARTGSQVNLIWRGPAKENDSASQARVVEGLFARRVSGIVLAPVDSRALIGSVDAAADAEIPVVAIESPMESHSVVSSVSAENADAGLRAAESMGELLNGKGKVLMLRSEDSSADSACEAAFQEGLRTTYPKIKIQTIEESAGAVPESAYTASQALLKRFGKDAQGVFTSVESTTTAMNRALKEAGLAAGTVKQVGIGISQPLVEAMRGGDVQALVVQDPSQLGYLGVKTLVQYLRGNKVERQISVPVQVITPATMDTGEIPRLAPPDIEAGD